MMEALYLCEIFVQFAFYFVMVDLFIMQHLCHTYFCALIILFNGYAM